MRSIGWHVVVALLTLCSCGGEIVEELHLEQEDLGGTRSIQSLSTISLSPISSYTETVYVFPVLMRRYDHKQIYTAGKVNIRVKLRAHAKTAAVILINGESVWFKTKMEANSSETYDKVFSVPAAAVVVVGEEGGSIEKVAFRPSGSSNEINLNVIKKWNQDILPAPVRFRRYDKRKIKRDGVLTFKIKLRGKELDVAAFKVNGKLVWKYWRISASTRNIKRDFLVKAGSEVDVGEYSGKIEYVQFAPDGPYRLRSNRTGHCLQRVGSSAVEVRACGSTSYQKLAFRRHCNSNYQIKFDGTNKCLGYSGNNVVQRSCVDIFSAGCNGASAKAQHWVPGSDGRWRLRNDSKRWLAVDKPNGNVYLLWQNDPYNNSRTKWDRTGF